MIRSKMNKCHGTTIRAKYICMIYILYIIIYIRTYSHLVV